MRRETEKDGQKRAEQDEEEEEEEEEEETDLFRCFSFFGFAMAPEAHGAPWTAL